MTTATAVSSVATIRFPLGHTRVLAEISDGFDSWHKQPRSRDLFLRSLRMRGVLLYSDITTASHPVFTPPGQAVMLEKLEVEEPFLDGDIQAEPLDRSQLWFVIACLVSRKMEDKTPSYLTERPMDGILVYLKQGNGRYNIPVNMYLDEDGNLIIRSFPYRISLWGAETLVLSLR